MKQKLGIPYMGSKRKLSSSILSEITQRHSNITDFYDLFGGGGSVSFTAIRDYRFNVHYNELNRHIYCLVEYLKNNKELEPKFYEWVTREEFFKQVGKSNNEADWYSGFVMSCWSFGNSQSSYLYGADIENVKHIMHDIIVNCKEKSLKEFNKIYKLEIPTSIFFINDINERRLSLQKELSKIYQLTKRVDLDKIGARKNIIVDNLGRLENLDKVQNLQNLQNLQISNTSYEKVIINPNGNPIIYCDIPYKGTGEYKEGGFDHEEFYKWFENVPYSAYLSEYDAPFEVVTSFAHRSSLSATNNKKKTIEKLFWNGKGEINKYKLF